MKKLKGSAGFTLIEVIVSTAIFVLFAVGIYSAFQSVLKAVYKSRINIIQTALLDELLEVGRNLPFDAIGIENGLPPGVLPHATTTYRNGIPFSVTTVVRSIDDPFDGVLGGTPNDLAPADYKLVEITVECLSCSHNTKTTVSTIIPPKDLEGSSDNGAIFIYVKDENNNPVAGARVHVENAKITPNVIIDDFTDNTGYLRIVDVPTSTMAYNITITKDGFSSDYTVASTTENPDPAKNPLTVSTQQITEVFFSVDELASMTIHSIDESCDPVANADFKMSGDKLIGSPNLKKYSQDLQTDAEGNLDLVDLEFDTYSFGFTGSYDLAGSLPMAPLSLNAGSHKEISLLLAPHTSNSLLVKVVDNENGLPLSDSTIQLKKSGYLSTLKTNFANFSQSDWSGGAGQTVFSEEFPNMYSNSFGVDTGISPGNVMLTEFAGQYVGSGILESSIFDLGKKMDLLNVVLDTESLPPETGDRSVLLQLALSNSSTPSTLNDFVGPDGTSGSFYSSTSTIINTGGQGYRYFRYKLFLSTDDQNFTPIFSNFGITFTNGCVPPGQVFFSSLSADDYNLEVSASGYDTVSSTINVSGPSSSTVRLYRTI